MIAWSLRKLFSVVRHSIILSFFLYISTCVSLFLFIVFYNWYLPKVYFERNVDLEIQNSLYSINNKDFLTKELVGHAYLFDGTSDSLHANQEYSISLIMDLPESDINFDVGMFGITVDVNDIDGRTSYTFKTMGTLIYKSKLLRYLQTLIYLPYYVFGRYEQKQTINILLRGNFIDNPYMPASKFTVRIHEKIQFYSVKLIVQAKLSGLKYMLHNWFYVTAFCISAMITSIIFIFFLAIFYGPKTITENVTKGFDTQIAELKNPKDLYNYDYYKGKLSLSKSLMDIDHEKDLNGDLGDDKKNKYLSYT